MNPEPRRTSDATLAQLRAWHDDRFGKLAATVPHDLIVATGPTGRTVLIDKTTGEIVQT
jgi:hypothetical protein